MVMAAMEKGIIMTRIEARRLGLAFGLTGALLYLGCVLVMTVMGKAQTIIFFNSLLHGIDVAPIIRMNVPFLETGMGLVQTFIISWLVGASIASIYNLGLKTNSSSTEEED